MYEYPGDCETRNEQLEMACYYVWLHDRPGVFHVVCGVSGRETAGILGLAGDVPGF